MRKIRIAIALILCMLALACNSGDTEKPTENKNQSNPVEAAKGKPIDDTAFRQIIETHENDAKEVNTMERAILLTPAEDLHTVSGGDGSAYVITRYGVYYVKGIAAFRVREFNANKATP